MASQAAMKISLFLLLTLSLSLRTHARDSQFFNKIPSTTTATNKEVIPTNQQEPNFLPETENSYGLYGHESGQNPPSTAATEFKQPLNNNKYLPKNYNPVAYVTQPEDFSEATTTAFPEETSYTANPENNNNNANINRNNYYYNNNQQQEEEAEFRRYPTAARDNAAANFYYNGGGSSFNSQPQGETGTSNRGAAANTFQPQGMSDTRYMENGKYFYDINSEKYSTNHPYETLRGARPQNQFTNRNFYANNAYEFNADNSMGGYQREDFQDEDNNMP